jgi:hypothetical protein
MANDLQIAGLTLPNVVVGACPSTVSVDVINAGPDPASLARPMTVCLDIRTSPDDGPPAAHYSVRTPPESQSILPGAIRTFVFTEVQFPCARSAFVKATADCTMSVPNNARRAPTLTVFVPRIAAIPWLWTGLRVGLKDSTGYVTWAPGALCPGATFVAEVSIRNAGCAVAVASVTTLELLDGAGQSIASLTPQNTPSIAPGVTSVVQFMTTLPVSVPGRSITVRACADDKGVVTPQCDRLHACAEITLPLAVASGGPKLRFFATRSIFPGEAVPISWRIQNFCNDIGKATAQVSFQGTVLYTSVGYQVGLQDAEKGEDIEIGPTAAVAPGFYKVGTSKLTLEITGTGTDPGPYTATTLVTVMLEPVSGNWAFTMSTPGIVGGAPWKDPYTVSGRLTNPAHAAMLPSSVVLDETSNVGSPIARIASPPIGAIVPGAFGSAIWSLIQTWSWLIPGVWVQTGPSFGFFDYSVTFAMQDAYGNAYPARTSASESVVVSVSLVKIAFAVLAGLSAAVGLGLAIAGLAAVAGVFTAVAAPVLFAAAGVAFTIAAGQGLAALDPPVANFDYRIVVATRLPELPTELTAYHALAPLLPVFALLGRINGVTAAMSATEARLIAARIDRDPQAIQLQSAEYRALRDSLLAAARQIPLAVLEAIDGVRADPLLRPLADARVLQRSVDKWSRDGVPAKLRRSAIASGLPAEQLKDIEQALRTPGFVVRPIDVLLSELTQPVAQIASGIDDESQVVLYPPAAGTHPEGGGEEPPGP